MNNGLKTGFISLLLFAVVLALSSLYVVPQGYASLVLRLGKLETNSDGSVANFGPGLHKKIPILNTVKIFDTRLQTLDIKPSPIVTKEKKNVIVDYYAKWRIEDLAKFYKNTSGNVYTAENLLEQFLNSSIRDEFGKRTIKDVVSADRADVREILLKRANDKAVELGMHVIDVRIKGIELPASTSSAIFQSMRANMEKLANRHRADGRGAADAIQAEADKDAAVIIATAQSKGEKIRAAGDAKAEKIYVDAYKLSPDFFAFYRSLKAYEKAFSNKNDIMVLNQEGQFFEYFKNSSGLAGDSSTK
jgi:membrane protease subunit HflC